MHLMCKECHVCCMCARVCIGCVENPNTPTRAWRAVWSWQQFLHSSSPVLWRFPQFSCAAPTLSSCPEPTPEVWVCNSDGYVGQVCLLSLRAEPDVEACIAVCSARILCIGAVPGLQRRCHR